MGRIIILDEDTSNKIAAGEVIDRPASVVKELVENSIDAGATIINVEIENGGIQSIRITDNGIGFLEDDVQIAFERHATSKIRNSGNLNNITILGFRGEALASIASVSRLQLVSRSKESEYGMELQIEGGRVIKLEKCGAKKGTSISVKDLFYNTPARYKFLKKNSTESRYVTDILTRITLGNPGISISLSVGGDEVIRTPGNGDLLSTIFSIYGKEISGGCIKAEGESKIGQLSGYIGLPEISSSNRNRQTFFVNGRYIKNSTISAALDEAYKTFIMKNRYPFAVLNVTIDPSVVDVNVHPTKQQVKFSDEQEIFRLVYHTVRNSLNGLAQVSDDSDVRQMAGINHTSGFGQPQSTSDYRGSYSGSTYQFNRTERSDRSDFTKFDSELFNINVQGELSEEALASGFSSAGQKDSLNNIYSGAVVSMEGGLEYRIDIRALKDSKIAGQLFSTYILLEAGDKVVLLDQHAAHERVMFEKIKASFSQQNIELQELLQPIVVDYTYREVAIIRENEDFLRNLGFVVEYFGSNSVIIRTVPYYGENRDSKKIFMDVVDYIADNEDAQTEKLISETLYKIACTGAIKANRMLADEEIRALLNELSATENPFNCPHGRPIMIILGKDELEKRFRRKI